MRAAALPLLVLLCVGCPGPLPAQPPAPGTAFAERLHRATELESQGRLDEAAAIYAALTREAPARLDVALRLESVYSRQGRHAESAALLESHLSRHPGDATLRVRYGAALFALGKRDEAFTAWEHLLEGARNPALFGMIAEHYERYGLDSRAAGVYRRGRAVAGDPGLFARELAQLSERTGNYVDAVREYTALAEVRPQYAPLVEARLQEMAAQDQARGGIFAFLADPARLSDPRRLRLLVTFAERSGQGGEAIAVIAALPPDVPVEGALWRLGELGLRSGDFPLASRACGLLLERTASPAISAQACLVYARAEEAQGRIDRAEGLYRTVLSDHARFPVADEAAFRLGSLFRQKGDAHGALAAWGDLVGRGGPSPWRYDALFGRADVFIALGLPDSAEAALGRIRNEEAGPERIAEAVLRTARLRFCQERFAEAGVLLGGLLDGALSVGAANDAIELVEVLRQGGADSLTLSRLARAEACRLEGRFEAALDTLRAAAGARPRSPLADRLARVRAEALSALGRYEEAARACAELVAGMPESPLAPWAQLTLGDVLLERLARPGEAAAAYERILVDYPGSVEADLARDRLRALEPPRDAKEKSGGPAES